MRAKACARSGTGPQPSLGAAPRGADVAEPPRAPPTYCATFRDALQRRSTLSATVITEFGAWCLPGAEPGETIGGKNVSGCFARMHSRAGGGGCEGPRGVRLGRGRGHAPPRGSVSGLGAMVVDCARGERVGGGGGGSAAARADQEAVGATSGRRRDFPHAGAPEYARRRATREERVPRAHLHRRFGYVRGEWRRRPDSRTLAARSAAREHLA